MRRDSVGEILATRTYEIEDGDLVRPATVLIGRPRRITDSDDFYCPYQVLGLGDHCVRQAEGVDEAQAIYIAMEAIGTLLERTPEFQSGRLRWFGEVTHGFPVRQQRARLRLAGGT